MYGKPYRGFESLSLRQVVWVAEKCVDRALNKSDKWPQFSTLPLKPDQRK